MPLNFLIRQVYRNIFKKFGIWRPFVWSLLFGMAYTTLAYRGDGLTIGGDNMIPLNSVDYLMRLPHSSNPWAGLGSSLPPIFSLPPIPDISFFSFFHLLNFDIYATNKLYVFALSTLTIISIFYLASTIFKGSKHKNLIGMVAAFAYVYNPWVLADTYNTMVFMELSIVQSGFIFFLAFVIRYFQTRQIRYSLYSGLISFLMLSFPVLSAYRMAFLALLAYAFIAIYYLVHRSGTKLSTALSDVFKGLAIVLIVSFVLNGYWIVPFVQNASHFSSFAMGFQTRTGFNKYSTMLNTLRLMNSWSFYSGYVPYVEAFIENPVLIALTFAWPILAFFPLLSRKVMRNRKILTIYGVTVLTILLACGSESPLGQTYMAAVNVSLGPYYLLKPFYNTGPVSLLVLTVEYAILVGFASSVVFSWLIGKSENLHSSRRKIAAAVGPILILAILASSSWPLLTGDVMRSWYNPNQYGVRIPDSYWEANEYLEKTCGLDHRTLLLPPVRTYVGASWGFQGTSQFYNLMFNVPLITGNEIPYGMTSNKTSVSQVYSIYYMLPDVDDTLEVFERTNKVVRWQSDKAILRNDSLQIDFNGTYEINKWHEVELRFPFANTWSNFTHMIVQLTADLSLDRLQIGIGDIKAYVGWWSAQSHVYELDNGTFIPTETVPLLMQNNGTITLLWSLKEPDLGYYSISDVTSVYIRYFVTNDSTAPRITINKMLAAKLSSDTSYYAELLTKNNIKYLLVDLSIKDGAKSDPRFWLDMLRSSRYFKMIWQKDTLYIFENTVL